MQQVFRFDSPFFYPIRGWLFLILNPFRSYRIFQAVIHVTRSVGQRCPNRYGIPLDFPTPPGDTLRTSIRFPKDLPQLLSRLTGACVLSVLKILSVRLGGPKCLTIRCLGASPLTISTFFSSVQQYLCKNFFFFCMCDFRFVDVQSCIAKNVFRFREWLYSYNLSKMIIFMTHGFTLLVLNVWVLITFYCTIVNGIVKISGVYLVFVMDQVVGLLLLLFYIDKESGRSHFLKNF